FAPHMFPFLARFVSLGSPLDLFFFFSDPSKCLLFRAIPSFFAPRFPCSSQRRHGSRHILAAQNWDTVLVHCFHHNLSHFVLFSLRLAFARLRRGRKPVRARNFFGRFYFRPMSRSARGLRTIFLNTHNI